MLKARHLCLLVPLLLHFWLDTSFIPMASSVNNGQVAAVASLEQLPRLARIEEQLMEMACTTCVDIKWTCINITCVNMLRSRQMLHHVSLVIAAPQIFFNNFYWLQCVNVTNVLDEKCMHSTEFTFLFFQRAQFRTLIKMDYCEW